MNSMNSTEEIINKVSDIIKNSEIKMRERFYLEPVAYEGLRWAKWDEMRKPAFRILCDDGIPLISKPIEVRLQHFEKIKTLADLAKKAMHDRMAGLTQERLQAMEDFVEDL